MDVHVGAIPQHRQEARIEIARLHGDRTHLVRQTGDRRGEQAGRRTRRRAGPRLVDHGDAHSLLGRRERRREPGDATTEDDQVGESGHRASVRLAVSRRMCAISPRGGAQAMATNAVRHETDAVVTPY